MTVSNAVNMFLWQVVLQRCIPFEMKLPEREPVAFGSLTKEQRDAELEKGMADIREGRTYSAQSVMDELKRDLRRMNWDVDFTDQARRDLRDILDYITYELQKPQVAVKLVR